MLPKPLGGQRPGPGQAIQVGQGWPRRSGQGYSASPQGQARHLPGVAAPLQGIEQLHQGDLALAQHRQVQLGMR